MSSNYHAGGITVDTGQLQKGNGASSSRVQGKFRDYELGSRVTKNLHDLQYLLPWELRHYSILRSCRICTFRCIIEGYNPINHPPQ